jgi:cysteine synthase A
MTGVTLAPDSGERYLETVYAPLWREEHYGARARLTGRHVLPDNLPTAPPASTA